MQHLTLVLSALVFTALFATGCGKKDTTEIEAVPVAAKATEDPSVAQEANPPAKQEESVEKQEEATNDQPTAEIGIAECDDYVAKMTACVEKMPEAARDAQKKGLNALVTAWSKVEGPAKEQLAATCKQTKDAAAKALKAQGCEF